MIERRTLFLWTWRGLGAALAVGAMEGVAALGETPLKRVPFVTSIALVMGMPEAEPAQPRALIGGHLMSTLVGFAVLWLAGPAPAAGAFAVGLALVVMRGTRTLHPPAAIDPLIVVVEDLSISFLLVPIASGALLLAAYAHLWHRLLPGADWPRQPVPRQPDA
ncbi:HPP family protein [Xanthobacter sp. DSM 24535]|uniref:HPP family protein n=1 Tax=Roseixanthobacter psychrophilus TaxID=3119917 RepID=UPI003726D250